VEGLGMRWPGVEEPKRGLSGQGGSGLKEPGRGGPVLECLDY
jgi:hypothetical protein